MDYKGYCLWASDVPAIGVPHYVIVSSGRDDDDNYLIVAISSIKYKPDGTPRYFVVYYKFLKLAIEISI